jgi:hypothetical protein
MADENKKPDNMLEALESASERVEHRLSCTFRKVSKETPDANIGVRVRMFHASLIRAFKNCDTLDIFQPTLGLLAKCLLPHLTDDEKEALRNDKLTGIL